MQNGNEFLCVSEPETAKNIDVAMDSLGPYSSYKRQTFGGVSDCLPSYRYPQNPSNLLVFWGVVAVFIADRSELMLVQTENGRINQTKAWLSQNDVSQCNRILRSFSLRFRRSNESDDFEHTCPSDASWPWRDISAQTSWLQSLRWQGWVKRSQSQTQLS